MSMLSVICPKRKVAFQGRRYFYIYMPPGHCLGSHEKISLPSKSIHKYVLMGASSI